MSVNMNPCLTDEQIKDLAKPLIQAVDEFFQNKKNQKEFEKWKKQKTL